MRLWAPSDGVAALLVALHVARNGYGTNLSSVDLRRALARLDADVWLDAFRVADELGGVEALVAGLRFLPAGRALSERFAPNVPVSLEWQVHQLGADSSARRLMQASRLVGLRRLKFFAGELFPSRAFMLQGWPLARRRPLGLQAAYAQRMVHILLRFPRVLWQLHRIKARSGTGRGSNSYS